MKTFEVGSHLNEKDLEKLIIYITKYFNYLNTMFRVEKRGDYFTLYWNMTESQYGRLIRAYWKDTAEE